MNIRNPYSLFALRLSAFRTRGRSVVERRITHMAYVMDSASWISPRPVRFQLRRVDIARIAVRVFDQLGRFARTSLAANMLARSTFLGATSKRRPASMASAPDPLANRLADEIRPARARGHRQRQRRVTRQLEMRADRGPTALAGHELRDLGLWNARVLSILLAARWVARALLAAWVLAVGADLVRAERRLAAVAGAAHSHADWLANSCELQIRRRLPLAGFQGQAIFGE